MFPNTFPITPFLIPYVLANVVLFSPTWMGQRGGTLPSSTLGTIACAQFY